MLAYCINHIIENPFRVLHVNHRQKINGQIIPSIIVSTGDLVTFIKHLYISESSHFKKEKKGKEKTFAETTFFFMQTAYHQRTNL